MLACSARRWLISHGVSSTLNGTAAFNAAINRGVFVGSSSTRELRSAEGRADCLQTRKIGIYGSTEPFPVVRTIYMKRTCAIGEHQSPGRSLSGLPVRNPSTGVPHGHDNDAAAAAHDRRHEGAQ